MRRPHACTTTSRPNRPRVRSTWPQRWSGVGPPSPTGPRSWAATGTPCSPGWPGWPGANCRRTPCAAPPRPAGWSSSSSPARVRSGRGWPRACSSPPRCSRSRSRPVRTRSRRTPGGTCSTSCVAPPAHPRWSGSTWSSPRCGRCWSPSRRCGARTASTRTPSSGTARVRSPPRMWPASSPSTTPPGSSPCAARQSPHLPGGVAWPRWRCPRTTCWHGWNAPTARCRSQPSTARGRPSSPAPRRRWRTWSPATRSRGCGPGSSRWTTPPTRPRSTASATGCSRRSRGSLPGRDPSRCCPA